MVQLSIIQFTPVWGAKSQNLRNIAKRIHGLKSDIIILPELCTTGYSFLDQDEALAVAEDLNGETVTFFKEQATMLKTMIIAGFAERDGDKSYNSALIALPDSSLKIYRKTHLFFKEKLCFEAGNTGFFVVDHPNVDCKIGIMVCNDWRYPESARSLALLGADIIVCPSNLVSTVWGIAMPARALENKVYVAVANRCGTEKRTLPDGTKQALTFNGGSVVYDFNGTPITQAGREKDEIFTVQIDPKLTRDKSFNAYNDLLNDRRPELYKLK